MTKPAQGGDPLGNFMSSSFEFAVQCYSVQYGTPVEARVWMRRPERLGKLPRTVRPCAYHPRYSREDIAAGTLRHIAKFGNLE